jgi:flagellar basal-body rod protein FlgF
MIGCRATDICAGYPKFYKVGTAMIRGMYSAATALDVAVQRQEVTAENLANLSTPGYRSKGIRIESFGSALDQASNSSQSAEAGVRVSGSFTNFQPGAIRNTGVPYQLALQGDGFFALQGPKGVIYSRNGSFHLAADGQILSDGNYPLLGTNGPISIPPDSENVVIGRDGSIQAGGTTIDQIRLTNFKNPDQLTSVGPTLYEAPSGAASEPSTASVMQGALEGPNVSPAGAMIDLIQSSRYFEAAQRAMRALSDAMQVNTRPGS